MSTPPSTDSPRLVPASVADVPASVWIVFAGAVALDAVTTFAGLSIGLTEANPVAASMFGRLGVVPSMVLLKGVMTVYCVLVAAALPVRWRSAPFLAAAGVWAVAGVSNLALLAVSV